LKLEYLRELEQAVIKKRISEPPISDEEWAKACKELQQILLQDTVKYVYQNVPYYRKLFTKIGNGPDEIKDIESLRRLPFITKHDILKNWNDLISRSAKIIGLRATSGTLGPRTFICVSREELEALQLISEIPVVLDSAKTRQNNALLLRIVGPDRPLYPFLWPINPLILSAVYQPGNETTLNILIELFYKELEILGKKMRIKFLSIFPDWIRPLTYDLYRRGIDPKDLNIESIYTTGGYVTQSLREFVKEFWRADVFSSYSLSEISVVAAECSTHKMYHFDFTAIPEVVDPKTNEPIPFGHEGILVLTSLYPFQQAQPLIRYWTGDVVILTNEKCSCGFEGISIKKLLGRYEYCIDMREVLPYTCPRKIFSYLDVFEILDNIPEITKVDHPKFAVSSRKRGEFLEILIETEVLYPISKEDERRIKQRIIEGIMKINNEWNEFFSTQKIRLIVKLRQKGKLSSYLRRI
jgi:phenylacetate-CoA ligase